MRFPAEIKLSSLIKCLQINKRQFFKGQDIKGRPTREKHV